MIPNHGPSLEFGLGETADAIRDQIKAAGIEVEDTPTGPKWTVS